MRSARPRRVEGLTSLGGGSVEGTCPGSAGPLMGTCSASRTMSIPMGRLIVPLPDALHRFKPRRISHRRGTKRVSANDPEIATRHGAVLYSSTTIGLAGSAAHSWSEAV